MAETKSKKLQFDITQVGCDFCPLKETWSTIHTPRMKLSGNTKDADILVLGEAPGKNEDIQGKIFVGSSGKLLRDEIPDRKLSRLAFQNTVRCRPEKNRTPTPLEVHCCSIHLDADVETLPIKAVLGCGNVPLHKFFPETSITKVHGTRFPVELGGRVVWFYPVFHPSYVLRNEDEGKGRVRPIYENDMRRFFKEVDKWPTPEIAKLNPDLVIVPQTEAEAQELTDRMLNPLSVDLETNSLYAYAAGSKILTASFSDGTTTISFPVDGNEWGLRLLLKTMKHRRWIAHNVGFELSWARFYAPGEPFLNFEDTMALARIYHQRETLLSLEVQSRIHLGVNVKKIVNVNAAKITTYPMEKILQYNGLDTMATAQIYHKLRNQVDEATYQRYLGAIESTTEMELRGLPVNINTAEGFKKDWTGRIQAQEAYCRQLQPVQAYERDTGTEFNIGSPKQLAAVLTTYYNVELPKTEKGNDSTDKTVLDDLANDVPLVAGVLEYREATKLVSTYIDAVLEVPEIYPDGMLHPGYTVLHTSTSRLSSHSPNIQNFPRRRNGEIRNMIEVPAGWIILACDYGQLEARVLAMASKDPVLVKSIIDGRDIHGDWRDNLLELFPDYVYHVMRMHKLPDDISEKDLLKAIRDRVKNEFVFASFYGSTVRSCAEAMQVPYPIMMELAEKFWSEFTGVKRWIKARRQEYEDTGEMRTLTGRVRYQMLAKHNEPINSPIQGTAADIVSESMSEMATLSRQLNNPQLHPRIQIHDDLSFIVRDTEDLEWYVNKIAEVLTKVRFPWQNVPLTVEVKAGTKWAELIEITTVKGNYIQ